MKNGINGTQERPISTTSQKPWYLITVLLIFWLPVMAFTPLLWKRLGSPERKGFVATCFLVGFLTFLMEFVYRSNKVWTFSEKKDRLIGLRIFGEPIEEFVFWWGATPFMLLVYLSTRLFRRRSGYVERGTFDCARW